LSVINSSTGAIERTLGTEGAVPGNTVSVPGYSVAVLKSGGSVAVVSSAVPSPPAAASLALTVVDLATGKVSGPLSLAQSSTDLLPLAVNPKTGVIYYSYASGGVASDLSLHIQEIDATTMTVLRDSAAGSFSFTYYGIVVSGDGEKIYVPTASGANVLDAASMQMVGAVTLPSAAYYMAISPDGSTLYVVGQLSFTLDFIDTSTLEVTQTVPIPSPGPIAMSPDGSQVYLGGNVYGEQPSLSILNVEHAGARDRSDSNPSGPDRCRSRRNRIPGTVRFRGIRRPDAMADGSIRSYFAGGDEHIRRCRFRAVHDRRGWG